MNTNYAQNAQMQLENIRRQYEQFAEIVGQQQALADSGTDYQMQTVDGIDGARAFKAGKNAKVPLFDVNEPVFFFKVTDANGNEMPLKKFRFAEEEIPKEDGDFVTMRDLNAIRSDIDDLKKLLQAANAPAAKMEEAQNEPIA